MRKKQFSLLVPAVVLVIIVMLGALAGWIYTLNQKISLLTAHEEALASSTLSATASSGSTSAIPLTIETGNKLVYYHPNLFGFSIILPHGYHLLEKISSNVVPGEIEKKYFSVFPDAVEEISTNRVMDMIFTPLSGDINFVPLQNQVWNQQFYGRVTSTFSVISR